MSPEINGNPPSVTKRKKNRERQSPAPSTINAFVDPAPAMSHCSYFPSSNPYQNLSGIPDVSNYYSFLNCSNSSEPMSLPVYPVRYPYVPNLVNNVASTPKVNVHANIDTTDYLSLPVETLDPNDEEARRRFSDPGVPNDSDDTNSNSYDPEENIVCKLSQQVNYLKESNRKLGKEVMELKIELNLLKQHHLRQSYDRDYEPGMLVDIIREVRDAARVREDALLSKVKHMVEERQLDMSHVSLVSDRNRNNERILKLEEQLQHLIVSQANKHVVTVPSAGQDGSASQVLEMEREALELRRELQDAKAKKEEADQKYLQLDKRLTTILRRNDISTSDLSDDGNADSTLSLTTASSMSRVTMSGPVTDL